MGVAVPKGSLPSQNGTAELKFRIVSACIADSCDCGHSDFVTFGTLRHRHLIIGFPSLAQSTRDRDPWRNADAPES
jgi:hypothetical protein